MTSRTTVAVGSFLRSAHPASMPETTTAPRCKYPCVSNCIRRPISLRPFALPSVVAKCVEVRLSRPAYSTPVPTIRDAKHQSPPPRECATPSLFGIASHATEWHTARNSERKAADVRQRYRIQQHGKLVGGRLRRAHRLQLMPSTMHTMHFTTTVR